MATSYDAIAVMVAISSGYPASKVTRVAYKVIAIVVESVGMMDAVMSTCVVMVGCGQAIVEVRAVGIMQVDAERPVRTRTVDRSVEVVPAKELAVLTATEHMAEVFVADVEQVVIIIDRVVVAEHDIIYDFIDVPEEVVVDFVHVVELSA
jgi:hypothetical protein